jgi:hypothetical protein
METIMTTGKWNRVLALFLAVMLPCSFIAAESRGAMVFATNSVIVNGSHISKTTAIFPGDKLTVPADSVATITLSGTSILMPKETSLTFTGDSILLEPQAVVAVNTTVGMAAQIKDIRISPAQNGSARYQVARYNGQVFIAAKQGPVLIASASGSRVLAEGSTTSVPDPEPPKSGSPPPAATGASGFPTWGIVLIAAAVAGVAAGVGIASTGSPASPSHP